MMRIFLISVAVFVFAFGSSEAAPNVDPLTAGKKECVQTVRLSIDRYAEAKFNACIDAGVDMNTINDFWTFSDKCLHLFNPDFTVNLVALETHYHEMGYPDVTPRECAARIQENSLEKAAKKLDQCKISYC